MALYEIYFSDLFQIRYFKIAYSSLSIYTPIIIIDQLGYKSKVFQYSLTNMKHLLYYEFKLRITAFIDAILMNHFRWNNSTQLTNSTNWIKNCTPQLKRTFFFWNYQGIAKTGIFWVDVNMPITRIHKKLNSPKRRFPRKFYSLFHRSFSANCVACEKNSLYLLLSKLFKKLPKINFWLFTQQKYRVNGLQHAGCMGWLTQNERILLYRLLEPKSNLFRHYSEAWFVHQFQVISFCLKCKLEHTIYAN